MSDKNSSQPIRQAQGSRQASNNNAGASSSTAGTMSNNVGADKSKAVDLHAMRHSMAHILATAVGELYPDVKFGIGPVIENGFYYDFDLKTPITEEDLKTIQKKMIEVVKANQPFEHQELKIEDAIKYFEEQKQPYKVELLEDLQKHSTTVLKEIELGEGGKENDEKVTTATLYSNGKFTDLCRGGHLESTGKVGAFKLTKVSGAYWRGDQANPQMQRIYGVAFLTKGELNNYLKQQEEAAKRDHRKLGQELDIFTSSEVVGAGLPLFTPKGTAMINSMMNYVREINATDNYQEVRTGHITKIDLYEKSGHALKFKDDLFTIISYAEEGGAFPEMLALKPMNCPHHTQLFDRKLTSYRDLPVKYAEFSTLHRNEIKGALGGLTRVRALTQDDAHAFVRPDQVEAEIKIIIGQIDQLMNTYGLSYHVRLSLRDPANMKAYLGDEAIWEKAENMLRGVLKNLKIEYIEVEGEAAFYGPKLDVMAVDAIGREWQVGTAQLDFNQPARFGLSYIAEDGSKQRPVMIHRALNGTFERMLGILIEHFAGNFPVWLAPEQVRLITVNDSKPVMDRAHEMKQALRAADIRVELDDTVESVGKKIRLSSMAKVPYTIVVGEKEAESALVIPRVRGDLGEEPKPLEFNEFVEALRAEITSRSAKSTL